MKTRDTLIRLFLIVIITASISTGQEMVPSGITISTGVGNVPSGVTLILDTTQRGLSMPLTIEFGIGVPFTEGRLVLELRDTVDKVIEKTTLWKEKAGDKVHNKYNRSLDLPIGIKLSILVEVEYKPIGEWFEVDTNGFCSSGLRLYIHRTSRWITVDESSFGNLKAKEETREVEEQYGVKIWGIGSEKAKLIDPVIMKVLQRKHEEGMGMHKHGPVQQRIVAPQKPVQTDTTYPTKEKK